MDAMEKEMLPRKLMYINMAFFSSFVRLRVVSAVGVQPIGFRGTGIFGCSIKSQPNVVPSWQLAYPLKIVGWKMKCPFTMVSFSEDMVRKY